MSAETQAVRRSRGSAPNELVFQVRAPPLGFNTYSVSLLRDGPPPAPAQRRAPTAIQNQVLLGGDVLKGRGKIETPFMSESTREAL